MPKFIVGGGKGHSSYPYLSSGGGTAYINCGDADRLLMIGNAESSWPSDYPTTILVNESVPGQIFHNVQLFNGSDLTFSRPPSSPLGATTAAIATVGGDGTGSLKVNAGDIVFLGSNVSVVASLDTTTVARRAISLTERQIVTTRTLYTSTVSVTGASICVESGGTLDLSTNVYICGAAIVNRGLVTGVSSVIECSTDTSGGFYYSGNPTGSTACGTGAADGQVGGCMNSSSPMYSPLAGSSDGSCATGGLHGCTYPIASNYDPLAQTNDGTCVLAPGVHFGCTYAGASNYDPRADIDDGSCTYPPSNPVPPGSGSSSTSGPSAPSAPSAQGVGPSVVLARSGAHLRMQGPEPSITFRSDALASSCTMQLLNGRLTSTCPTITFDDLSSTGECSLKYDGTKLVSSCPLETPS